MPGIPGTKKIKILHVLWSLEVAGAEKLAVDMARSLAPAQFCPIICSVNNDGLLGEQLRQEGYMVYHRAKAPGLDWGTVRWLRDIIVREEVDVVHAHQYSPMVYAVLAAVCSKRVTLIYTEHGRTYPEVRRWKRRLVNPLLAHVIDGIVSISENTRQAMIEYDRLPGRRIRVVHNGVHPEKVRGRVDLDLKRRELEIPDGFGVVGTAARFDEVKNLPMMLRAFRHVLSCRPKTMLLMAGAGILEPELKRLAYELGVEKQVRFLGLRHDLPDLLRVFDVFLLTSFTEGVSITLLEAMANRIPAVVTRVGGNPEVVVEGETGFLVPLGGEQEMADKVVALLDHPELAAEMGISSRRRVEQCFSFDQMMMTYLEIYGVDAALWSANGQGNGGTPDA